MSAFTHDRSLVQDSWAVFQKHPQVLVPLLVAWIIYAPAILYLRFGVPWDELPQGTAALITFGAIFLFATLLTVSCSILLELLQDIESGNAPSLGRAMAATMSVNLLQMVPIIIIWTVIWFVLAVIQAMLTRKKKRLGGSGPKFNAENAARALATGGSGRFSFTAAYFRLLQKIVRMVVFLMLPAIAWENQNFYRAMRRGVSIFRSHPKQFATAFGMTELVALLLFIPPALLFWASSQFNLQIPDAVWMGVIIYIGAGWMYSIYLEQMYTAELYLWHMKWERSGKARIEDVKRPSLLDRIHELAPAQRAI